MNGVLEAAVEVDRRLTESDLPYCLIGGIALQRWGQPRTTLDVDVTVVTEFGNEEPIIQQLLDLFEPRIADAADFARQSRTVLAQTSNGVGVDIALGALPFESRMIDRSTIWNLADARTLRTCSAEDLIVQKAFAGRDLFDLTDEQLTHFNDDRVGRCLDRLFESDQCEFVRPRSGLR